MLPHGGQSRPRTNSNKEVLRIPQSSIINGDSPSDCLVSLPGHSLREFYLSAVIQSVYFVAQTDWVMRLNCFWW